MGLRTVFFGTPEFAVPALDALAGSPYRPMLAVTRPDSPKGRGYRLSACPVKERAMGLGIDVESPEALKGNAGFSRRIAVLRPDLIVVVSYGNILPTEVLAAPRLGCVNIHGSLLPQYRGAAPVHRAILAGEEETGVSLMYLSEGLDEGDVIGRSRLPIGDMDTGRLQKALSETGASLLMEYMPLIEKGEAPRFPQDHFRATYAPMVRKEEGHIDFSAGTGRVLRLVRAMTPAPGAYAMKGGQAWKVRKASGLPLEGRLPGKAVPGEIIKVSDDGIAVATADGAVLLEEIQTPGKRPMKAADYLRGNSVDGAEGFS